MCTSLSVPMVTKVSLLGTTRPEFCNPMNAMNNPMPGAIAFLRDFGIALTIAILIPETVRMKKSIPSMRMAVSANCHEYPMLIHTANTKNEFMPMPGAITNGRFA